MPACRWRAHKSVGYGRTMTGSYSTPAAGRQAAPAAGARGSRLLTRKRACLRPRVRQTAQTRTPPAVRSRAALHYAPARAQVPLGSWPRRGCSRLADGPPPFLRGRLLVR